VTPKQVPIKEKLIISIEDLSRREFDNADDMKKFIEASEVKNNAT